MIPVYTTLAHILSARLPRKPAAAPTPIVMRRKRLLNRFADLTIEIRDTIRSRKISARRIVVYHGLRPSSGNNRLYRDIPDAAQQAHKIDLRNYSAARCSAQSKLDAQKYLDIRLILGSII